MSNFDDSFSRVYERSENSSIISLRNEKNVLLRRKGARENVFLGFEMAVTSWRCLFDWIHVRLVQNQSTEWFSLSDLSRDRD